MTSRSRLSAIIIFSFTIIFFIAENAGNSLNSHETGAPAGYTGSPGDNFETCRDCHAGPAETFMAGWITSNVPPTGYVPGTTYTLSATITRPGHVVSGFEVSPQDASGNILGSLIITSPAQTKLVGSGDYVTHTAGGTSSPGGTKTWTFNWIAPSQSTGNVTFYGAFNATNNGNNQLSDTIFVSTLLVQECQLPLQPSSIIGSANVCNGVSTTYKIQRSPDATSYVWSIPAGWSGTSTDTFITVTTGPTGGNISVSAVSDCGTGPTRTLNVSVSNLSVGIQNTIPTSCFGSSDGGATASSSNGSFPYSYSWNTIPVQNSATAIGLAAGNYIVTTTDGAGCTATTQAVIGSPVAISVSANSTHSACPNSNNGSANASVLSGGFSPFAFSWNSNPVQNTASASNLTAGPYIVTVTDAQGCTQTNSVIVPLAPAASVTVTSQSTSCNGGSDGTATATPSSGLQPFTYSWNTIPVQTDSTATNLSPGAYSVFVTDGNGCTFTGFTFVFQPSALSVTSSFSNALCFGTSTGQAIATASGGTSPYTYSWNSNPVQNNDTATLLPAGNYTVTITDTNSCTQTSSVTIAQPISPLSATTNGGATTCFGGHNGSASVSASGGTGPYSYLWSTIPVQTGTNANNLLAGTFNVTVTDDNGCTFSTTASVTQPTAITSVFQNTNVTCFGGNDGVARVSAAGGTGPYTYTWFLDPPLDSDSALNLKADTFLVTITDSNGCTKTSSTILTEPGEIILQTTTVNANCNQANGTATVIASGGVPGYSYAWTTFPVQHSATAHNLLAGIYGVTVTDASNCVMQTYLSLDNNTPMILNIVSVTGVSCYGFSNGSAAVTVSNAPGPVTYHWLPTNDSMPIATGLPSGNVSITVIDTNNCQVSEVIIIPEPAQLIAYPSATATICSGDSIIIGGIPGAMGGTGPYTFQWSPTAGLSYDTIPNPVASPGASTIYTMLVTDSSGCTSSVNDTVNIRVVIAPLVFLINDTLYSSQAPNYQWYRNDTLLANANQNFFVPLIDGDYKVMYVDTNGCQSFSSSITYFVKVAEVELQRFLSFYPNPANHEFNIVNNFPGEKLNCTISSLQGKIIRKIVLQNGLNKVYVSDLPNGCYLLHLYNSEKHFGKIISILN